MSVFASLLLQRCCALRGSGRALLSFHPLAPCQKKRQGNFASCLTLDAILLLLLLVLFTLSACWIAKKDLQRWKASGAVCSCRMGPWFPLQGAGWHCHISWCSSLPSCTPWVSLGKGLEKQRVFRRHYFLFLFFVIANGCTAFQLDPLPGVFSWVEAGGIAWFGGQGKRREVEGTGRRVFLGHTADKRCLPFKVRTGGCCLSASRLHPSQVGAMQWWERGWEKGIRLPSAISTVREGIRASTSRRAGRDMEKRTQSTTLLLPTAWPAASEIRGRLSPSQPRFAVCSLSPEN